MIKFSDCIKKRAFCVLLVLLCITAVVCVLFCAGINIFVTASTSDRIYAPAEISGDNSSATEYRYDCILVLGCSVKQIERDGQKVSIPSDMLEDRLLTAKIAYDAGVAPKIIVSGDHGLTTYNEVGVMKKFLIDKGVPSENIFMDHAGFSTYESVYRAKEIFSAKKVLIVTQQYHLYRAVFIADALELEASGLSADLRTYRNQASRDIREVLARVKDFFTSVFKPSPAFMGDKIDLSGSGDVTNDEYFENLNSNVN